MDLGRIGVFAIDLRTEFLSSPDDRQPLVDAVVELEELGFTALWIPGGPEGAVVLDVVGAVLAATDRVVLGTDILTIWTRDPEVMAHAFAATDALAPGRFMLGLGASHANLVEPRGQKYEKPVAVMRDYLEGLDAAAPPVPATRRMIAALGPRMLEVARDASAGTLPYMVGPQHTSFAREILGNGPLLAPEQAVVLETDAGRARAIGRDHVSRYFHYTNYVSNFRRQGFDDDDFLDGGSDRLVDAIVAWGDVDAIGVDGSTSTSPRARTTSRSRS